MWLFIKMRWCFIYWKTKKWLDQNHPDKFWRSTKPLNMANLFFKKESLCLMHRFFLLLFVLSLFSFHPPLPLNTQLKIFCLGPSMQILLIFSSTFWALTVCDIHFCVWWFSKFIFLGYPLFYKMPEFWR